ncbi:fasciclin-like arabinogalactan protein 1 [Brachypodium distachyon]|uniref:fasciclin-like arabinogalactan protein 1 n=1 Tax=Brachypodium distachyon TaxID=15368 RepID=UPI0005300B82|nr:fasciclin-like arabinogalactan protein 1 [Brachypodium distachyon]|eukprot:XP_010230234.1 fasciclin-like arabinogalactan protein 1 [Brachypodium distachyon]
MDDAHGAPQGPRRSGMVKSFDRRSGRVGFLPQQQHEEAVDNNGTQVFFVKSVHETPYNISVMKVSTVISSQAVKAPSLPESARPNATGVVARNMSGCFAALMASAGAASRYEKMMANDNGGLRLFCPANKATKALTWAGHREAAATGAVFLHRVHVLPDAHQFVAPP